MELVPRDRVPELTGLLTIVSLALVFGAAGGAIPGSVLPATPEWLLAAIPHANAAISLAAIAVISVGWRAIRRGNVARHRAAMVSAFVLFVAFLVLYLYRLIAMGGPASFPGPATVERFVYLPILAVHIGLAVICVPLLYYVLLLAASRPIADLRRSPHAAVGRVAASLWLVSFALGVVVYLLLYVVY